MGQSMHFMKLVLLVTATGLSACATVDFAEMAPQTPKVFEASSKTVVRRASDALVEEFTEAGWVAPPEKNRIQKTAGFLLKGIKKSEPVTDVSYAAKARSLMAVNADIKTAAMHVEQAVKAADVFLAMAAPEDSLRRELKSLEGALVTSRRAEVSFEEALAKLGAKNSVHDMEAYYLATGELTRITNAYGVRVRDGAQASVGGAS